MVAGKNQLIHGRPCRTEIAKAQRPYFKSYLYSTTDAALGALYVSRHNGKAVTDEDVRILLSNRGDLEKVFAPTDTEREIYQLPLGLWVRFAFFQDCRDAIAVSLMQTSRVDSNLHRRFATIPTFASTRSKNPQETALHGTNRLYLLPLRHPRADWQIFRKILLITPM